MRSCLAPWQTPRVLLQGLRVRRGKVAECDQCSAEYSTRAVVFFLAFSRLCFGCDIITYVGRNVWWILATERIQQAPPITTFG